MTAQPATASDDKTQLSLLVLASPNAHQIKCDRVCHHGPVRLGDRRTVAQPLRKQYALNSGLLKAYCSNYPEPSLQHYLLGSSVTIRHVHTHTHTCRHMYTISPLAQKAKQTHLLANTMLKRRQCTFFFKSKQHAKLVKTNNKN